MSTLDAALAWAARGFRVFPLAEGTKDQHVLSSWLQEASSDPAIIRRWWIDPVLHAERDYNIGYDTSNINLVDIDVRNGKRGFENYLQLGGHFETLVVKTASGGRHCLFNGDPVANRVGILDRNSGLDIRGHHGYAVAPGSITSEGRYTVECQAPLTSVPPDIKALLRAPLERVANSSVDFVETPSMIERAVAFLQSAEPAVESQGGDDLTFRTAARLRDLGITEKTAYDLVAAHFNPRCIPPWPADMLVVKVANAYAYGTAAFGAMAPELHFAGGVAMPAGAMLVEPATDALDDAFTFGNALDPLQVPPRPWIMSRLLLRRHVTALVGAGSAGKSVLLLEIAAHLAMGQGFMGYPLRVDGPLRSIIYNEEDDLDETSRRLWAICSAFQFDFAKVRNNIALVSRKQIALQITKGDPPIVNNEHVGALIRAASQPDVGLVGLDPLVSIHSGREDDNASMTYVMGTLRLIAEAANVPVVTAMHTPKNSGGKLDDMYAARGAGSIINSARIAYNLATPNAAEANAYGIEPDQRNYYVAMTDAKMNLALSSAAPKWLKKRSLRLPNGDEVGVLEPFDMAARGATIASTHALIIALTMKGQNRATCTLSEAGDMLRSSDLLMTKLSLKELQAKVLSACATPVETPEGTIKVIRDLEGGNYKTVVVLE